MKHSSFFLLQVSRLDRLEQFAKSVHTAVEILLGSKDIFSAALQEVGREEKDFRYDAALEVLVGEFSVLYEQERLGELTMEVFARVQRISYFDRIYQCMVQIKYILMIFVYWIRNDCILN